MDADDEQALFDRALDAARRQAELADGGEGVAAAGLTDNGATLVGVWVDAMVDSACLCAETGPICEAHRIGASLVASICVRWTESAGATVLAACGVCQERLAIFGTDVAVAVADNGDRGFHFVPLTELRPSPWWDVVTT